MSKPTALSFAIVATLFAVSSLLTLPSCSGSGSSPAPTDGGNGGGGNNGGNTGGNNGGNTGGNNGGNTGTGIDLNKGSYDVAAFDYVDDRPATSHPLKSPVFVATRREELAVSFSSDVPRHQSVHATLDDRSNPGSFVTEPLGSTDAAAFRASGAGRFDSTPGDELAVIDRRDIAGSGLKYLLDVKRATKQGGVRVWSTIHTHVFDEDVLAAWVRFGNIDDDAGEEILVALLVSSGTSYPVHYYVFDDASGNGAKLHYTSRGNDRADAGAIAAAADVDGDGQNEVVLGLFANHESHVQTLAWSSLAVRGAWQALALPSDQGTVTAASINVGNFDADPAAEIAVSDLDVHVGRRTPERLRHRIFSIDEHHAWVEDESLTLPTHARFRIDYSYVWTPVRPVDLNGDRVDELVLALHETNISSANLFLIHGAPKADSGKWVQSVAIDSFSSAVSVARDVSMDLAAADDDGDDKDELTFGYLHNGVTRLWRFELTSNPNADNRLHVGDAVQTGYLTHNQYDGRGSFFLTPGDFDAENLLFQSMGKSRLTLPDPVPIIVLAAPPLKDGITQNRGVSSSGYGANANAETENSHEVRTDWALSLSQGSEQELADTFTASVQDRLAYRAGPVRTGAESTRIQSFRGASDKDVIVFQGTLYKSYEYQVVGSADPGMVGRLFTIDEPVATKLYEWTVDFYNDAMPASARMQPSVLAHEIGDPSSYVSKAAAQAAAAAAGSWASSASAKVGNGTGSESVSFTFSGDNSDAASRSMSVGRDAGLKIGYQDAGITLGLASAPIYSIDIVEGAEYSGVVGHIEDAAKWSAFAFDYGLLAQRIGVDSDGDPLPGKRPFMLLTYWVDQLGSGY